MRRYAEGGRKERQEDVMFREEYAWLCRRGGDRGKEA
jgi:hypothetical protein